MVRCYPSSNYPSTPPHGTGKCVKTTDATLESCVYQAQAQEHQNTQGRCQPASNTSFDFMF